MKLYRYLTGPDDSSFCHRATAEINKGCQIYGQPTLTYDQVRNRVICGQAIVKEVQGEYTPGIKLSEQ